MKYTRSARNYAVALFSVSKKLGVVDRTLSELNLLSSKISSEIESELKNPVISRKDIIAISDELSSNLSLSDVVSNFLKLVLLGRRLDVFSQITSIFDLLVKKEKNIIDAEIISISKLNESEIGDVLKTLTTMYSGKTIQVKNTVDNSIIGGLQIKIDSLLIDASVKSYLSSLEQELIQSI